MKAISHESSTLGAASFKPIILPADDFVRDINDEEMDLGQETVSIVVVPSSIYLSGKVLKQRKPTSSLKRSEDYNDQIRRYVRQINEVLQE